MLTRHRHYVTEKEQRDDLRSSLKFSGSLIILGVVLAIIFMCEGEPAGTCCVGFLWAAFWAVPFGGTWLELRRLTKK